MWPGYICCSHSSQIGQILDEKGREDGDVAGERMRDKKKKKNNNSVERVERWLNGREMLP